MAGGYSGFFNSVVLSTVEILDTLTGYWHRASPLPEPQYKMSSTLIGNMWYLLGGYPFSGHQTLCICVCIDGLLYHAVLQSTASSPSPWQRLPDTLSAKCTALSLNGALLAVGGVHCPYINLYKLSTNSWVKVGDSAVFSSTCVCLHSFTQWEAAHNGRK